MDVQVRQQKNARIKGFLIMFTQMPIRDGYSATHAIRTEAPWKDMPEVRNVPIVAMTASAIQGDKEKCQLAGMDVSGVSVCGSYVDAKSGRIIWQNLSKASSWRR
jgi:CheY-like chemotaxis protein